MALLYADMVDRHQVREKPRLRKKRFDLGTVQTKILNNDIRKKESPISNPNHNIKKSGYQRCWSANQVNHMITLTN